MGRGNVSTTGPYEGLYFVDNDYYVVYRENNPYSEEEDHRLLKDLDLKELQSDTWLFDDWGTNEELDDILSCFKDSFKAMFPEFEDSSAFISKDKTCLLESNLFYICMEDNEWSIAVELLQKDGDDAVFDLQRESFAAYLNGIKKALLERLPSVGYYTGPWTHGTVMREDTL